MRGRSQKGEEVWSGQSVSLGSKADTKGYNMQEWHIDEQDR